MSRQNTFNMKSQVIKKMFESESESDDEENCDADWEVYNKKRVTTDIDISVDELSIYIRFITHHKDIMLKLYATKLSETIDLFTRSSKSYTDKYTYVTPTKYDLAKNNEPYSKIFIGEWWKHPGLLFKGKHYPTIKDPTDKTLSFKILIQAYLGRIRQFAFFKDCHNTHIDQLSRIAAALRIRISSDNHPQSFKPILLIHQIWSKATFNQSPPSFLPFISWSFT